MSKPIIDKAEVAIDFPDKFYHGTFGRGSRYDVTADEEGIHLHLMREDGEKRHVGFHIHYQLLSELLAATAEAVGGVKTLPEEHRARLKEATKAWAKLT